MSKINVLSLEKEVETRLKRQPFGENNSKCVVVRLNNDMTQKDSIQDSIFNLRAHGFRANIDNAQNSSFIILTDAKQLAVLASIVGVEPHETEKKRINIYFRDHCHIDFAELSRYIDWNNSNPIRVFECCK